MGDAELHHFVHTSVNYVVVVSKRVDDAAAHTNEVSDDQRC
jgi:hypothetical protein